MKQNKKKVNALLASAIGLASLSSTANAEVPRGMDIDPLASNCRIAKFPQTSKAGAYNNLCDIMQDAEKCLALIKGQFIYNGSTVSVSKFYQNELPRAQYCLNRLKFDLGLSE